MQPRPTARGHPSGQSVAPAHAPVCQPALRTTARRPLLVATADFFPPRGHSVDDAEPKYGMAVTGLADPLRLLCNAPDAPAFR